MNKKEFDKEFLISEQHDIYNQATWIINQIATLEKLALISSSVIWAWIASHTWNNLFLLITWLPSIIVLLLFIKVFLLSKSLKGIQNYFLEIENSFNIKGLGWQQWKAKNSKKFMTIWAGIYWLFLFSANTLIAIFFPFSELSIK